ncbi:hypothetical protein HBI80_123130 [Parastagonospora nodorum]|nr:hypothetical protein HBH42_075890 [Parastagonospora nodorum]KAH4902672.1 hypothetical protein HBI80_123130 [Parastagonospora nodorum]
MAASYPDPRSLNPQEIRLLEIYPSTIAHDDLECRLFRITLDSTHAHPYEALSYTWGDQVMRTDIVCNDQRVSITSNLSVALKKIRLQHKSRFIWADGICINQDDSSDKNCQIPLMGKIYSIADRVVVWLGDYELCQSLQDVKTVGLIAEGFRMNSEEGGIHDISLKEYSKMVVPNEYTGGVTQEFLKHLYARGWFSRVWCIQEIALARDAVMLWGELELSWVDVGQIATWLSQIQPVRALEFDESAFYADIDNENADRMYQIQRKRQGLLETLDDCRSFQATDPRDKVYGILALVEPIEEASDLCVDYNKDVGEVYADVVIAILRRHSDLNILAYIDHGSEYRSDGSFTSWSPQWNNTNAGLRYFPASGSPLSACRSTHLKSVDTSDVNSQYLRLNGSIYSSVTTVQAQMGMDAMKNHCKHPFYNILTAVLGHQSDDDYTIRRTLARTLTAGCNSEMDDIITASEEKKRLFYVSFELFIYCMDEGLNFLELRKSVLTGESFYDEAEIVCLERRFFQLSNGKFGIGPACMRVGDVVVVLFGGDAPYVLRPCGRSYLLMGQAYVDELMNGELMDELDAGRVQERQFVLV